MNNVNAVSQEVETKSRELISTMMSTKSAMIGEVREEVSGFAEEVFDNINDIMENEYPELDFGASHSEGRFWLKD